MPALILNRNFKIILCWDMKKKHSQKLKGGDRKMKYLNIKIVGHEKIQAYENSEKESESVCEKSLLIRIAFGLK